ncbi:hypothetical protein D4R78_07070 [bacterium]|nr:MAG: hypothetical protein D4R78_07070 [bacterium]
MKERILKYISIAVVFLLCLLFIAKLAGPTILRMYVEIGIANCQKIPILCVAPTAEIKDPQINKEYLAGLTLYKFSDMHILMPKTFLVVKEKIKKVYYKRVSRRQSGDVAYLLYERPYFFKNLFLKTERFGIKDDYDFFSRTMYAKLGNIQNLTDVFFVIIKSIFIPDLGSGGSLKIVKFSNADFRGFISYSLSEEDNYFDCNIFNRRDEFFKIYIKDKSDALDLNKVLAIISTINKR